MLLYSRLWADEAICSIPNQIGPARMAKRFFHQRMILRLKILKQCALKRFFLRRARNLDFFHRIRIQAGIKHAGGYCARRGVKILHLLWVQPLPLQKLR